MNSDNRIANWMPPWMKQTNVNLWTRLYSNSHANIGRLKNRINKTSAIQTCRPIICQHNLIEPTHSDHRINESKPSINKCIETVNKQVYPNQNVNNPKKQAQNDKRCNMWVICRIVKVWMKQLITYLHLICIESIDFLFDWKWNIQF